MKQQRKNNYKQKFVQNNKVAKGARVYNVADTVAVSSLLIFIATVLYVILHQSWEMILNIIMIGCFKKFTFQIRNN